MFRVGSMMRGFTVDEMLSDVNPPIEDEEDCSDIIDDTKTVVVCSRVCKASVGALATCYEYIRFLKIWIGILVWTYCLCTCIGRFYVPGCNSLPNIIDGDAIVFPRYGEKW